MTQVERTWPVNYEGCQGNEFGMDSKEKTEKELEEKKRSRIEETIYSKEEKKGGKEKPRRN